jgi:hypothetical protein
MLPSVSRTISSPKERTTHFSRQILYLWEAPDGEDRRGFSGGLIYTNVHHKRGQDPVGVLMNRLTKFGFQKKQDISRKAL